jgi:NAD(P)-dependent dehydrogenase (short-subunit alcohol dehydrogenase family)
MDIANNTFIVTGGASGLGAATARMIAAGGGHVVIADLQPEAGQMLATQLGESARFIATDVCSEASAQNTISTAVETFGAIHGLINCAGIAPAEKMLGKNGPHSLDAFAKVIQVNLIGSFNMIRLAVQTMITNEPDGQGERGVIVSTASVAAFEGQIGQAAYAASKGGLVAMNLPIARELARFGIRVLGVAPGIMETPMLLGMPPEVQESLGRMVPFPSRLGKPTEFAALVGHIIGNPYLNGETIRLDGAIRMGAK